MEADTILIPNLLELDSRGAKQIRKECKFLQTVL